MKVDAPVSLNLNGISQGPKDLLLNCIITDNVKKLCCPKILLVILNNHYFYFFD